MKTTIRAKNFNRNITGWILLELTYSIEDSLFIIGILIVFKAFVLQHLIIVFYKYDAI